jgi:hypothetical protein
MRQTSIISLKKFEKPRLFLKHASRSEETGCAKWDETRPKSFYVFTLCDPFPVRNHPFREINR